MRVLVLGGTAFVGRHATAALLARGHQASGPAPGDELAARARAQLQSVGLPGL